MSLFKHSDLTFLNASIYIKTSWIIVLRFYPNLFSWQYTYNYIMISDNIQELSFKLKEWKAH